MVCGSGAPSSESESARDLAVFIKARHVYHGGVRMAVRKARWVASLDETGWASFFQRVPGSSWESGMMDTVRASQCLGRNLRFQSGVTKRADRQKSDSSLVGAGAVHKVRDF